MNTRYNTEHDLQDLLESDDQDREISLSTATILGIFFALALLCAVFFGFGYSMGRKSGQPATGSAEVTTGSSANSKADSGSSCPPLRLQANRPLERLKLRLCRWTRRTMTRRRVSRRLLLCRQKLSPRAQTRTCLLNRQSSLRVGRWSLHRLLRQRCPLPGLSSCRLPPCRIRRTPMLWLST